MSHIFLKLLFIKPSDKKESGIQTQTLDILGVLNFFSLYGCFQIESTQ